MSGNVTVPSFSITRKSVNNYSQKLMDAYIIAKNNNQTYFELPSPIRKLKASYTVEMMEDLTSSIDKVAKEKLLQTMKQEIQYEHDLQILKVITPENITKSLK